MAAYERDAPPFEGDTTLFYLPVQDAPDPFSDLSDYNLSFVACARRGVPFHARRVVAGGVEVPARAVRYLRWLRLSEEAYAGLQAPAGERGGAGGMRRFATDASALAPQTLVNVHASQRSYRFGVRLYRAGTLGYRWHYALSLAGRWGPDARVRGVYTDMQSASLLLTRRLAANHSLSLLALAAREERGVRTSSLARTFELTGDRNYNPAWGRWGSRVRNSHVARDVRPFLLLAYSGTAGRAKLHAAAAYSFGPSRYSALAWFDARTPLPDHYSKLPDRFDDPLVGATVRACWEERRERYTQLDWEAMVRSNGWAGGRAVYLLEDRVERAGRLQTSLRVSVPLGGSTELACAAEALVDRPRYYKQVRDLLGAAYALDVDQYLIDDDRYGDRSQNDLRRPGRVVGRGDRYGYDYRLRRSEYALRAAISYRDARLSARFSLSVGRSLVRRRGFCEKELFPGAGSFGLSPRIGFPLFDAGFTLRYALAPNRMVELVALAAAEAPEASDLFLEPRYNNRLSCRAGAARTLATEAAYVRQGGAASLRLTFFATRRSGGVQVRRYYDDASGVYSDMVLERIGRLSYGIEAGLRLALTGRLELDLGCSAGSHTYRGDPRVTIYADEDNRILAADATSRMNGYRLGGAPGLTLSARLGYSAPGGWNLSLAWSGVAERYVDPAPLRRMARTTELAGSPEQLAALVEQERLPAASSLDASVMKSWRLRGGQRLTLFASARNLTGCSVPYNGYEQMRLERRGKGLERTFFPAGNKYTYTYPCTWYFSATFKF